MKEVLINIKDWGSAILYTFFYVIVLMNIKGILEGFKGKDGKWSVNEFSKLSIILFLGYIVYVEGSREEEWHKYDSMVFLGFIFGLFALAELKDIIALIADIMGDRKLSEKMTKDDGENI